jgi:hypothetical protein
MSTLVGNGPTVSAPLRTSFRGRRRAARAGGSGHRAPRLAPRSSRPPAATAPQGHPSQTQPQPTPDAPPLWAPEAPEDRDVSAISALATQPLSCPDEEDAVPIEGSPRLDPAPDVAGTPDRPAE